MKRFLLQIFWFCLLLTLLFLGGIILPATPRASTTLLFSKIEKDSLLRSVIRPRIIFVGGSNLSFGLNSQLIKDSLNFNPINTAVHASIGLKYMMDNTLPFVQEKDMIVLAPEYQNFYGSFANGKEELLRTIFDLNIFQLFSLRNSQLLSIIKYIPKYSISKFDPREYFHQNENAIYGVNSFNEFGDAVKHWGMAREDFSSDDPIMEPFNNEVIQDILTFQQKLINKGATLLITFPCYQSNSFDINSEQIRKIENAIHNQNFLVLGTATEYKIPDSLMFNNPYHLSKAGAEYRTQLLINDLKKYLKKV